MKFKYNIFNLVTASIFVLAFLSLMISYATSFIYYVAIVLFAAGFAILSIILMKRYIKNKNIDEAEAPIVMELSGGVDGETYVMMDETKDRQAKKRKFGQTIEKLLPFIFSSLASLLFLILFIRKLIVG